MKQKITLSIEEEVVNEAKHYAVDKRTSVSQIVEDLLKKFFVRKK